MELQRVYGPDLNQIDFVVGGLLENTNYAKSEKIGPTFALIIFEQLKRLRDGDRFWFENDQTRYYFSTVLALLNETKEKFG